MPRLPAQQRVLPVLAIAQVIGEGPVGIGHGEIVLFDPSLHFREQRRLQRRGIGERALAVVIFLLQISADGRIELFRIAHDLLPVGGLEPAELVAEVHAMEGAHGGPLLRARFAGRAGMPLGWKLRPHSNPILVLDLEVEGQVTMPRCTRRPDGPRRPPTRGPSLG